MTQTITFKLSKEQLETGTKLALEYLDNRFGYSVDFESIYRYIAGKLPHRLMVRGMERRELAREIAEDALRHLIATGQVVQTPTATGVNEPGMLRSEYQYRLATEEERKTVEKNQSAKERLTSKLTELTNLLKRFGITGFAFEDPVGLQGLILKSEDDVDGLLRLIRRVS